MKACLKKMEAMIKARQEQRKAEMKAHREEMKAMMRAWLEKVEAKLGTNQEKIERAEATHLTTMQNYASDVLHGDTKGVTYMETIRATGDRLGDQQLAIGHCNQLKTRTQDDGESWQEFSIKLLTPCAFPTLHEDHDCRGLGKAFGDGMRDRSIKQQLLLGGKRTLNEAPKETLWLEVIKLTVGSCIRVWKTSDRALWRSRHPPK
jgi:hypothetical protein